MQFRIKDILNSDEIKNNNYFKGSVEICLLNLLYREKELSDREYIELKEKVKKVYNLY